MFAPRVAKPNAKQSIDNQAGLRRLRREGPLENKHGTPGQDISPESLNAEGGSGGLTWDFSKIPLFPPKRMSGEFQSPSQLPAPRLPGLIQRKLKVGTIDDPLEHEADRVAEQVMRMPSPQSALISAAPPVGRKRAEQLKLYKKEATAEAAVGEAPASVHEVLCLPGQPLDPATRGFMEPRFGRDFSGVRVHTDSAATQSARELEANAYAIGSHIVFGADRPLPESPEGRRLLAHELAHVVQQSEVGPGPAPAPRILDRHAGRASANVIQRDVPNDKPKVAGEETKGEKFPWIGRIQGTYSAALRLTAHKDPNDPHAGTIADLPEGTFVDVLGRVRGWLHVQATIDGKEVQGYVSQELIAFDRYDINLTPKTVPPTTAQPPVVTKPPDQWSSRLKSGGYQVFVGGKGLTKGEMRWQGAVYPAIRPYRGDPSMQIEISFNPKPPYRGKVISFLQTFIETVGPAKNTPSKKPVVDILLSPKHPELQSSPFYGVTYWDKQKKQWVAWGTPPPFETYKNQPSSAADPTAYLFDAPSVPPTEEKMFETVAVIPETTEILGALRWGVTSTGALLGAKPDDCTDVPLANFAGAIERFYEAPKTFGPHGSDEYAAHGEYYDAILDSFPPNDGTPAGEKSAAVLNSDHQKQLDAIANEFKRQNYSRLKIELGGFADATETDPVGTSDRRLHAAGDYLIGKGVPTDNLRLAGEGAFGAAWARFPPGPNESRNRRVQLRFFYPPPGQD
jgi:hypothetical protein